MRKHARWIFGYSIAMAALALAWQYGFDTWKVTVLVLGSEGLGALIAFGPEIYGALSVNLPGGSGVNFGNDDCNHDGGKS